MEEFIVVFSSRPMNELDRNAKPSKFGQCNVSVLLCNLIVVGTPSISPSPLIYFVYLRSDSYFIPDSSTNQITVSQRDTSTRQEVRSVNTAILLMRNFCSQLWPRFCAGDIVYE